MTQSCGEVHSNCDIYHPEGHPGLSEDSLLAVEVIACALELEAEQYDHQYGKSNPQGPVIAHAAQIVRGLFGGGYAYLLDEAVSRAERRQSVS